MAPSRDTFNDHTLPQIKLDRLSKELDDLQIELEDLDRTEIQGGFNQDNDAKTHIKEISYLRSEMEKILSSDAFKSIEGKSSIEKQLNTGTHSGVNMAMNEMIQSKIIEYSN